MARPVVVKKGSIEVGASLLAHAKAMHEQLARDTERGRRVLERVEKASRVSIAKPYGVSGPGIDGLLINVTPCLPDDALQFCLEGEPVTGKNKMQIRWNRDQQRRYIAKSDEASAWQLDAIAQLVQQRGRKPMIRGRVFVDYTAYQRRDNKDLDNIEAALFDALKKAKVIEDDRFITDHSGRKRVDASRPRIEVTVSPLKEA